MLIGRLTAHVATRVPASRVAGFARVQLFQPVPIPQPTCEGHATRVIP